MRALLVFAATTAVLGLTACDRGERESARRTVSVERQPVRVITRLDCPQRQGRLTRTSVAADGRTCGYAGRDAEVTLRLVALNGDDAAAALAPIEAELKTLVPGPAVPPTRPGAASADKGETASIRLPGVAIDARPGGADVRIGGLSITSRDDDAVVRVGDNVNIRADEAGAVDIRANNPEDGDMIVRAGEDGAVIRQHRRGAAAIRATLILASDKAPSGYHLAGYEARGPNGGPLVVAVVKAKDRDADDHDVFKDMKALIRHNVGG